VSVTVTNQTGDGVLDDLYSVALQLPDTDPGNITLVGQVQAVGQPAVTVTGGPLTVPPPPTSGQVFYNVQIDSLTGVATLAQDPTADPAPTSPTTRVVFRQTLTSTSTDPALTPEATPDDAPPPLS